MAHYHHYDTHPKRDWGFHVYCLAETASQASWRSTAQPAVSPYIVAS